MDIPTLVLAAGKSTRIAGLAGGRPKPLLEVGGRTILEWNLDWLVRHGVRSAWVNLHYRPAAIRAAVDRRADARVAVRFSEEDTILGTAGGWKRLEPEWTTTSLVLYGDNLTRFDLSAFVEAHRARRPVATVALFDPTRHASTGIAGGWAELASDGRLTAFREGGHRPAAVAPAQARPEGPRATSAGVGARYVNAGVYLLDPQVADRIGEGYQDFGRDVLPRLAEAGEVDGYLIEDDGFCLGVDTPERFDVALRLIESGEVAL